MLTAPLQPPRDGDRSDPARDADGRQRRYGKQAKAEEYRADHCGRARAGYLRTATLGLVREPPELMLRPLELGARALVGQVGAVRLRPDVAQRQPRAPQTVRRGQTGFLIRPSRQGLGALGCRVELPQPAPCRVELRARLVDLRGAGSLTVPLRARRVRQIRRVTRAGGGPQGSIQRGQPGLHRAERFLIAGHSPEFSIDRGSFGRRDLRVLRGGSVLAPKGRQIRVAARGCADSVQAQPLPIRFVRRGRGLPQGPLGMLHGRNRALNPRVARLALERQDLTLLLRERPGRLRQLQARARALLADGELGHGGERRVEGGHPALAQQGAHERRQFARRRNLNGVGLMRERFVGCAVEIEDGLQHPTDSDGSVNLLERAAGRVAQNGALAAPRLE